MMQIDLDNSLAGKVVLVTGGASGLGEALCRLLAGAGACVTVADLDGEKAGALALALRTRGQRADAAGFDVGDAGAAERTIEQVVGHWGRLDVLINSAGTDLTLPLTELTAADWLRVIGTNLNGPFFLSRSAAMHMIGAGGGHIINITSTAAKRAWPNASAYHASKWGLLGLSHAMHAELRPHGV